MKVKIEVEVSKETHEVGVAVAGLVSDLLKKKTLAEVAAGALLNLQAAVDGLSDVSAEPAEDPGAFARAIAIPLSNVLSAAAGK